jgi:exodeoxyribonuclease VII small subunit
MAKLDFEKALAKLEQIVAEMEADELNLDQMLAKFKEGVALAKACAKRLNEAERTIEVLAKTEDGGVQSQAFDAGGAGESADGASDNEPEEANGELPF